MRWPEPGSPGHHPGDRLFAFGQAWQPPLGPGQLSRHRGGRGRRANVREAILTLLTERSMHGYEMIQEIERRSRGTWRPSPGSVYPTLQLLEDEGLIAPAAAEGGRKRYNLTESGQASQGGDDAARAPWEQFSEEYGESVLDTRAAIHGVMQAVGEVMRVGSEGQRAQANQVLEQARRQLYRILADRE
ncbi:helix-turn-helix transcriptional regulator [Planosporangium flavigriseum]|uniref:Transcriptional regulator n=1 Tax=Planosporangium flavigriseum TaxID=373681 RepID=A0A8J3LS57_9ACTN|nr:PadR family transcriptional regulator [Planosporangium flavigriseum]NJC64088.1 helix-turn-helix transcriptional regulator [Planosporangium flavigriseum]GIG72969.1 transcriptional regulator [Planosporangium flavigriseum]